MPKLNPSKLKKLRLFCFDVDGVFTPGNMAYGEQGDELKFFHFYDGMALELLRIAGFLQKKPCIIIVITSEKIKLVERRFRKLKVNEIHLGAMHKTEVIEQLQKKYGVSQQETFVMGDDVQDIPMLARAGFRVVPPNAPASMMELVKKKKLVDYIPQRKGGEGAVREVIDLFLKSIGLFDSVLAAKIDSKQKAAFRTWQEQHYQTEVQ